jgi:hypothetical protein
MCHVMSSWDRRAQDEAQIQLYGPAMNLLRCVTSRKDLRPPIYLLYTQREVDCNETPIYLVSSFAEMTLKGLGHSLGVQRCVIQKSAELASGTMKKVS